MEQHYFIGIRIPPSIDSMTSYFHDKYQLPSAYKVIVPPEDYHLTLHYIGACKEQAQYNQIVHCLTEICALYRTFSLRVTGIDYFGNPLEPRVVYLSIEENELLLHLQREIIKFLTPILHLQENSSFTPHITIAKKRKTTDVHRVEREIVTPYTIPVTAIALFAVYPNQSPSYKELVTFDLPK